MKTQYIVCEDNKGKIKRYEREKFYVEEEAIQTANEYQRMFNKKRMFVEKEVTETEVINGVEKKPLFAVKFHCRKPVEGERNLPFLFPVMCGRFQGGGDNTREIEGVGETLEIAIEKIIENSRYEDFDFLSVPNDCFVGAYEDVLWVGDDYYKKKNGDYTTIDNSVDIRGRIKKHPLYIAEKKRRDTIEEKKNGKKELIEYERLKKKYGRKKKLVEK